MYDAPSVTAMSAIAVNGKRVEVRFSANKQGLVTGITIDIEGCETFTGDPGVIFVDIRSYKDGSPEVIVWADMEEEDPTHMISLRDTMW